MLDDMTFVFVHGGAHGAWCWDRVRPHLDRPSVAVDLPGRGSRPSPLESVTLQDFEDAVIEEVEAHDPSAAPLFLYLAWTEVHEPYDSQHTITIAEQKGVDLASISGSGPKGRIVKADVEGAEAGRPFWAATRSAVATLLPCA